MVSMDDKAIAEFVKITINGFDEAIRCHVAFEIFLFASTQKGWKDSTKERYNDYHCTYRPGTDAYNHAKILTSPPFNLKSYVIVSIKDYPEIWEEESCLIWNRYM